MKILGMGTPELLIILVVVLLIFGPKNLPKLGSGKKAEEASDEKEVAENLVESELDTEEQEAPKTAKKRVVKKVAAAE